ncbi:Diacylglycerol kinase family enzyme [Stackebrandtia soli]
MLSLVDGAPGCGPRTQVLACSDALKGLGASVALVDASDNAAIDAAIDATSSSGSRLIVAADTDAQVRAVVRRAVRLLAPPPSKRPDDLPDDRTIPDLPPIGILPLAERPAIMGGLGLPVTPAEVAAAVVTGRVARTDLLRHDGGGVTIHGVRIGGGDRIWRGKIALDDVILSDGSEPLVTCVVANAGYGEADGLPLCEPDAADGVIDVAIATPFVHRGFIKRRTRIEVRRARGRAVAITPVADVPHVDDGTVTDLTRKRTWWMERGAAGWYTTA